MHVLDDVMDKILLKIKFLTELATEVVPMIEFELQRMPPTA